MKRALLSLLFLALLASHRAHADTITTYYITDGTLADGGSYSGSFVFDSTTRDITGGSIEVDDSNFDGTLQFWTTFGYQQVALFGDDAANFQLYILPNPPGPPELCSGCAVGLNLASLQNQIASTGGTISATPPAVTPEPTSLILLGIGTVGLAGAYRRRVCRV